MPAAIQIQELGKGYEEVLALRDVSFEVAPGTCTALLGPNGAGKSTLLSILATLRRPDGGTASIAGHDVVEDPGGVRRALGVVFQEPLVSKHLKAWEVLDHHARLYGLDRATRQARTEELLAFAELTDRREDRVATFSGGMKRRLDLARVLMTEPAVLLLDEPTAGLDVRGRRELQGKIAQLTRGGTAVLLATHDLQEAAALASQVAVLDRGRLLAHDTPEALATSLGHRVVRVTFPEAATADQRVAHHTAAREVLEAWGEVLGAGAAIELLLDPEDAEGASPGQVVDELDQAGVTYKAVTVREPDLGDAFLGLTGRQLDQVATADQGGAP